MTATIDGDLVPLFAQLGQFATAIVEQLGEAGVEASHTASQTAPRRTGRLAASVSVTRGPDANSVIVQASAPYAPFVLYGTRYVKKNPFLQRAVALALRSMTARLKQRF